MAYEQWTQEEKIRRSAKQLFKIEIIFRIGPETKTVHLTNYLPAEFMKMRENFMAAGFHYKDPEERGHGWVIPPFDIVSIEYWVQESFIEP